MKLLHTSDWHLGNTWNGRSRRKEFAAFLDWLLRLLQTEKVDVLVVAGDVFDTATPSTSVQSLYYDFLESAAPLLRQIVVVAGNHDSPHFLDAPQALLRRFGVRVVGAARPPEEELVRVDDDDGRPAMLIGAVPFLRDRDLRKVEAGESAEDRDARCIEGIRRHYADLCAEAGAMRLRFGRDVPLVATGHLYVAGSQTSEGVRDVHFGAMGRLGNNLFSDEIDYFALGHLHLPQRVAGLEHRRYCGSPLPMSFDDAERNKLVLLVEFEGRRPTVRPVDVPRFSNLVRVRGTIEEIQAELTALAATSGPETCVEVVYTGLEAVPDLARTVDEFAARAEGKIDVLRIRNERALERFRFCSASGETLEELEPIEVFERLLADVKKKNADELNPDLEADLIAAYREIVRELREDDTDESP